MKSIIFRSAALIMCLGTVQGRAMGTHEETIAKVREIAEKVGADLSGLEKEVPRMSARRSESHMTRINPVDGALLASEEAAIIVAAKHGVVFPLDGCYRAASLYDAKAVLNAIKDKVGKESSKEGALRVQAGELLRVAAFARNARISGLSPGYTISRSVVAESSTDAKLALAVALAEAAELLAGK